MKTINNAKSKYMCGATTSDVIVIVVAIFLLVGWVMNIAGLWGAGVITTWGGMEIARVIGVVVFPVGGVLGWF